jgi:hypothetical protein
VFLSGATQQQAGGEEGHAWQRAPAPARCQPSDLSLHCRRRCLPLSAPCPCPMPHAPACRMQARAAPAPASSAPRRRRRSTCPSRGPSRCRRLSPRRRPTGPAPPPGPGKAPHARSARWRGGGRPAGARSRRGRWAAAAASSRGRASPLSPSGSAAAASKLAGSVRDGWQRRIPPGPVVGPAHPPDRRPAFARALSHAGPRPPSCCCCRDHPCRQTRVSSRSSCACWSGPPSWTTSGGRYARRWRPRWPRRRRVGPS